MAHACTQCAPAINAASELAMASPRSLCPCQSTRIFSLDGLTTSSITNFNSANAPWCVAGPRRIADHDGPRSAIDRRRIQPLYRLRIAACRVFGDVHVVEAEGHRIFHGLLR